MKRIVLIRHGESQWNKENRFTGWTNVDLSEKGVQEALDAGKALKEAGITFEVAYTSYLKRAIKTLNNVLDAMDLDWIPVKKTWRLNEKHYGMLQGLKNCIERVMPYWECEIFPALKQHDNIVVVAHGNSLRGVVKHLKGISDADIVGLNIPTATPYVFEFDDDLNLVKDYYLADPEELKRKQEAVAKQGKAK